MNIGQLISEYREKNNLTQSKFGKLVGVNKQTVSKWESGQVQPRTKKIYEILKVIGIDNGVFDELDSGNSPFIYSHKNRHNVGLNALFSYVYDFDSFSFFIDAFSSAFSIINEKSECCGFLLIGQSYKDEDTDGIPIFSIQAKEDTIELEIPSEKILIIDRDIVEKVENVVSFNNQSYSFNIFLNKNNQKNFVQIILDFNFDSI